MGASRIYLTVLLLPATKLRQCNVFTPVCHSVHGGGVCNTPLWADPPGQTRLPSGADTPRQTPPHAVHAGIRSTSGRYASYWNAFLFGF